MVQTRMSTVLLQRYSSRTSGRTSVPVRATTGSRPSAKKQSAVDPDQDEFWANLGTFPQLCCQPLFVLANHLTHEARCPRRKDIGPRVNCVMFGATDVQSQSGGTAGSEGP